MIESGPPTSTATAIDDPTDSSPAATNASSGGHRRRRRRRRASLTQSKVGAGGDADATAGLNGRRRGSSSHHWSGDEDSAGASSLGSGSESDDEEEDDDEEVHLRLNGHDKDDDDGPAGKDDHGSQVMKTRGGSGNDSNPAELATAVRNGGWVVAKRQRTQSGTDGHGGPGGQHHRRRRTHSTTDEAFAEGGSNGLGRSRRASLASHRLSDPHHRDDEEVSFADPLGGRDESSPLLSSPTLINGECVESRKQTAAGKKRRYPSGYQRPMPACKKQKRKSSDEKFLEDNSEYYGIKVLPSKLRSSDDHPPGGGNGNNNLAPSSPKRKQEEEFEVAEQKVI